jgi:hypothetical protein
MLLFFFVSLFFSVFIYNASVSNRFCLCLSPLIYNVFYFILNSLLLFGSRLAGGTVHRLHSKLEALDFEVEHAAEEELFNGGGSQETGGDGNYGNDDNDEGGYE